MINTINNNIWFVGSITDTNVHYIIQELEKLQTPNASLFLNTDGGSVHEGLYLFDHLQSYLDNISPLLEEVHIESVFITAGDLVS